jgi:hypothetical protein
MTVETVERTLPTPPDFPVTWPHPDDARRFCGEILVAGILGEA